MRRGTRRLTRPDTLFPDKTLCRCERALGTGPDGHRHIPTFVGLDGLRGGIIRGEVHSAVLSSRRPGVGLLLREGPHLGVRPFGISWVMWFLSPRPFGRPST